MTLDETIKHAEKIAEQNEWFDKNCLESMQCKERAEECRQLAEWLKELKQLREQTKWIPVSEGLPEEKKTVIASTEYGAVYPEARYTKENGWEWAYESGSDYWEELECVTAWMPLPKSYEPQEGEMICDKCLHANVCGEEIITLLEKTYNDFCECEGGEGWLKVDGKEYSTDAGYALDGMRIFMEVFKQRLVEDGNKK